MGRTRQNSQRTCSNSEWRIGYGHSRSTSFCFWSIMLQDKGGNDPEYLAQNMMRFLQAANSRPEIGNAFSTFQANVPQRYMDIDKEKAMKLGVDLNELYTTVGAFMGGAYVNDFTRFGRLYKTYIQAEPQYRNKESDIANFFIKNNNGDMVPLSTLATIIPIYFGGTIRKLVATIKYSSRNPICYFRSTICPMVSTYGQRNF